MKLVKLEQVAKFINGRAFKPSEWETEGLPIIRIQNLTGSTSTVNYYSKEVDERYYVKDGDILISWSASLGVYKWQGGDAILNQHIFKVVPNEKMIDREYFYYAAQNVLEEMKKHIHGATMQHITRDPFLALEIPLPPLPEQKRIAAQLAQADRLRQLRRNASQLGESYLQSAFLAMFGKERGKTKVVKLGKLTQVKTGGTPSRKEADNFRGKIPWVKTTEVINEIIYDTSEKITEKGMKESNCEIYPVNTILLAMYGQGLTRGRTGKLGIPATTNQACAAILPSTKINTDFLWAYLKLSYNEIRDLGRGGNQPNLNLSMVRDLEIPLPPLPEQERFAQIVARDEGLRAQMRESTRQAELLFQGLLHESFQ